MAYPTISGNVVSLGAYATRAFSTSVSVPATSNSYDTQLLIISTTDQASSISSVSGSGWSVLTTVPATVGGVTGITTVYKRTGVYAGTSITVTYGGTGAIGIVHGLAITGQLDAWTSYASTSYASTGTAPSVTAASAETLWVQTLSTAMYPRVLTAPAGVASVTFRHDYIVGSAVGSKQVGSGATGTSGTWAFTDPDTAAAATEIYQSLSFAFSIPSGVLSGGGTFLSPEYSYATTSLTVTPSTITVTGGAATQTVTVTDQNGQPVQYATWTSDNSGTATASGPTDINGQSTITIGGLGTATLTVTYTDGMSGVVTATATATLAVAVTPANSIARQLAVAAEALQKQGNSFGLLLQPNEAITAALDIAGDTLRLRTTRTPASSTATGSTGMICWDSNYVYVCVAANTWKRFALSTW